MPYKKIFEAWLNSSSLTEKDKKELLSYSEEEKKKRFDPKPLVFGTGGIRILLGLGTQRFNKFTCRLVGRGYAKYLKSKSKKPSCIVAHDNRKDGDKFSIEIASILKKEGVDVYLTPNNKPLSTPILSFLIKQLNLDGGINITASHNPPEYNGLKVYNSTGKQINIQEEIEMCNCLPPMEEAINIEEYPEETFNYIEQKQLEEYFENIKKSISNLEKDKKIKCLFSSHHGTTSKFMKKFINSLGFEEFEEYKPECNMTWKINEHEVINPEDPQSFSSIIKEADKREIKYVFGADPDGDRVAIGEKQKDGSWYFLNGNEIGVLTAHFKHLHNSLPNPYIVSTYVSNTFINKLFPSIPIYRTSIGFKNISDVINEEEAKGNNLLIAYEEAMGSIIHPIHREKDSYQQLVYLLHIISYVEKRQTNLRGYLDELRKQHGAWKSSTDFYYTKRQNMEKLMEVDINKITDYIVQKTEYNKDLKIFTISLNQDSWIKFRYSETEPKLKIYYNLFGNDQEKLEVSLSMFRSFFSKKLKSF